MLINYFFFIFLGLPSFLYFAFLVYVYFSSKSFELGDFFVQFIVLSGLWGLLLYLFKENVDKEWKYVFLMTRGISSTGKVTLFSRDINSARRWCEYSFFDLQGYGHKGKMTAPIRFDNTFDFVPGQDIEIRLNPEKPEFNIVFTPKIEIFNLRKGKEDV